MDELFDTEGTVTVSTDHTSGTAPFDFGTYAEVNQHPAPITAATEFDHTLSGVDGTAPVVNGGEIEAIEFRVIRAGSPVRRLRLTGNRYTFGNAEGCSIRLHDHALRPMHAVMIRDENRILVRAYSVPIEVNSARTTEAILRAGDVIRLGEYRFELLPSSRHTDVSPHAGLSGSSVSQSRHVSRDTAQLRSLDDDIVWRERLRREVDQWRARQVECDRRELRCDDREADLRGRESELWTRAEHLRRRESQLKSQESAALQIQHEYASKQEELVRIREENRARQREFDRRESEYRDQVAEASRQLQQSQQQAAAANQAVQRMRDQFSSLNKQLEALSAQQQQLENHERHQREEHQQLRQDLERARDEAIDARAESEACRQAAEARVEELTARLQQTASADDGELESARVRLAESEELARQLQQQVADLQQSVRQAGEESAQLRQDYEGACETVRQLESTIQQSTSKTDQDRDSWLAEAEQLRHSVEQLSVDLANANSELSELREANQSLNSRLDEAQRQRDDARTEADDARADADARPTTQAWQALQQELDLARDQLNQMQQEYDQILERLDEATAKADQDRGDAEAREEGSVVPAAAALAAAATFVASENEQSVSADNNDAPGQEEDDEAWPTYQTQEPDPALRDSDSVQPDAIVDGEINPYHDAESEIQSQVDATSDVELTDEVDSSSWADEPENAIEDEDLTSVQSEPSDVAAGDWSEPETPQPSSESAGTEWQSATEESPDSSDSTTDWNQQADAESVEDAEAESTASGSESDSPWQNTESNDSDWSADSQAASAEADADTDQHTAVWSDTDAVSEDSPWQSTDESTANDEPVEMTSPWDNADESFASPVSDEADDQDDNPWSTADNVSDPGVEAEAEVDESSPAEGSLASMLIKDIESGVDAPSDEPYGDTYAMNVGDQAAYDHGNAENGDAEHGYGESVGGWEPVTTTDDHDETSDQRWDEEHLQESLATSWSNDEDGFRHEAVAEDESVGDYNLSADLTEVDEDAVSHWSQESDPHIDSEVAAGDEPADVVTATDPEAGDASPAAGDVDDDSIEAYMNRLLQRVQGDDKPAAPASTATNPVTQSTTDTASKTAVAQLTEIHDESTAVTEDAEKIDPNAPLVPRSLAPEKNSNLSAMRALANESARSAINRSVKIQSRDTQLKAMGKFAQAGVALLCAAAFYMFIVTQLKYICIAAIFVIAGICVREGLQLMSDAKRRLQQAEADLSRPSSPTTSSAAAESAEETTESTEPQN